MKVDIVVAIKKTLIFPSSRDTSANHPVICSFLTECFFLTFPLLVSCFAPEIAQSNWRTCLCVKSARSFSCFGFPCRFGFNLNYAPGGSLDRI